MQTDAVLLCDPCQEQLQLVDWKERCPYCFTADFEVENRVCTACRENPPLLNRVAAAFDYIGPGASLIRHLKYSGKPYLAKGCAAYLAAQFLELDWPMPDVIIPVPITFTHWFERGYNQSRLLADHLGEILNKPVQEAIKRKSGEYSQAGLSKKQRLQLGSSQFSIKKDQQLQDKCLLLIDDVMTTGSTMRKCAEVLLQDCPASIYGLTVCCAIN